MSTQHIKLEGRGLIQRQNKQINQDLQNNTYKSPFKIEIQRPIEKEQVKNVSIKTKILFDMKFKTQVLKENKVGVGLS